MCMKKKSAVLASEVDLMIDLTFHDLPASLLAEFAMKIVKPYYSGNFNMAIQDLIQKTLSDQEFVNLHITQVRSTSAHW